MAVLKTTSPERSAGAPKLLPSKTVPSSRARIAESNNILLGVGSSVLYRIRFDGESGLRVGSMGGGFRGGWIGGGEADSGLFQGFRAGLDGFGRARQSRAKPIGFRGMCLCFVGVKDFELGLRGEFG